MMLRIFQNSIKQAVSRCSISRSRVMYRGTRSNHQDTLPRVINLNENPKKTISFTTQEMNRRLANLRKYMASESLEACVFTSHHNILYFSDFMAHDWGRPSGLFVTHDDSVLITPNVSGVEPYRRSYSKNLTFTDWQRDNFFFAVQKLAGGLKTVGIELDHVVHQRLNQFVQALQGAQISDLSDATMNMRMIKSEEEIERLRNGARIADIGYLILKKNIQEGIAEFEIAEAVTQAMKREISATYPDQKIRDVWTWITSGENTDSPHNDSSSKKIQSGDILSFNAFPTIGGYFTALERTLFFDHVTEPAMRVWQSLTEVHNRGLELLKSGVRCCDIANELNELMDEKGILKTKVAGFGYSKGIAGSFYGRDAGLELREYNETVLQPNMVISMMSNNFVPGLGGFRDLDCVVIKELKSEVLPKTPRGPEHCIIKSL